jgi:transcriptional regulator with XRE-family HTH domain
VSERTSDRRQSLWEKFKNKAFRHSFVSGHLANNISAQIFSTREARGWTQQQLAEAADMAQARISVMENSAYENFSLNTLKRLAAALDVALIVRFVPFSELLDYATNMDAEKLAVREFKDDMVSQPDEAEIVVGPEPNTISRTFVAGTIELNLNRSEAARRYWATRFANPTNVAGINFVTGVKPHSVEGVAHG